MTHWILNGHEPSEVDDVLTWAKWFETADRIVAKSDVGAANVSTVFLGIDHRFVGDGPPILFETMIFGLDGDEYQERCSTWAEAEAQHLTAVTFAKAAQDQR